MVDSPTEAAAGDDVRVIARGAATTPPRAARRRWVGRAVLGVFVLGAGYVGATFAQVWHASRTDDLRASDAIVVLGAAQYDGLPSPAFQNRLDTAFALYERGVAPRIVTTGSNQAGDRFTEADSGSAYLIGLGVPESAVISVPVGRNTWQELEATADVLLPRGQGKVTLVSDPYHAYRVARIADDVGLDGAVASTPGSAPLGRLVRETAGASVGRFVGYERLSDFG